MISKFHSNRQLHNWIIYDIGDKFLQSNKKLYKGVLYDFGCGEAARKSFFLECVDEYIGVDWQGSHHATKADIKADLNKPLDIDDAVADTIVSLSVLEHLCEPQTMLNEAYRILKPGGKIILQVPWQWSIHEAPYDYYRYTPYGLKHMFSKAGFSSIAIEATSGFFTTWFLKFNYFTYRFVRGPLPVKLLLKVLLTPIWYLGQKIAPLLDKLDFRWELESQGYYVIAEK